MGSIGFDGKKSTFNLIRALLYVCEEFFFFFLDAFKFFFEIFFRVSAMVCPGGLLSC